jgi:hypothetical protein
VGRRIRAATAIALVFSVFLSGCVSVYVDSAPGGAQVFVDGQRIADTPCRFKAKTFVGVSYDIVVHHDGYKDWKGTVESEFDPYMLVLILSPLIILIPFLGTVSPRYIHVGLEPDYDQPRSPATPTPR